MFFYLIIQSVLLRFVYTCTLSPSNSSSVVASGNMDSDSVSDPVSSPSSFH